MKIERTLMATLSALLLCSPHDQLLARQLPGAAGGGIDKGNTRPNFASCVREVDRGVSSSGTNEVQYITRFIKVKNACGVTFNVTLDVAYQTDPKCEKLRPGKTTEFVYTVSTLQPPPQEYRRIKQC